MLEAKVRSKKLKARASVPFLFLNIKIISGEVLAFVLIKDVSLNMIKDL